MHRFLVEFLLVLLGSSMLCPSCGAFTAGYPSTHSTGLREALTSLYESKQIFENVIDDSVGSKTLRSALAKMGTAQASPFFQSSPALKEFRKKMQGSVKVDTSSIAGAGQGLFASKNLKAGTVVGFYPVHCLGVDQDSSSNRFFLNPIDQKHFEDQKEDAYIQYLVGSRPLLDANVQEVFGGNALFVDVNPNKIDREDCWVGHYVNDGAVVTENSEASLLSYYTLSRRSKNCVHVPFGPSPFIATITTRKVKKGEEMFTSYGGSYWLDVVLQEGKEEATEITNAVQDEAKGSARDLLLGMQSAQTTYVNQVLALNEAFNNL